MERYFTYVLLLIVLVSSFIVTVNAQGTWEWTTPTKGADNAVSSSSVTIATSIIINEVLPYPGEGEEFVELYNYGQDAVDMTGWYLQDAAGKKVSLETSINPDEYYVRYGSFSLNNSGDESLYLYDMEGNEVDYVEYSGAKKGESFSRFCDVYELHFCDFEMGLLTPGEKNKKGELNVETSRQGGDVTVGTEVTLSSSDPEATIYYSLDPNSSLSDALSYNGPITIEHDVTISFFALKGDTSSPIKQETFHVISPLVSVSEVLHLDKGWYVELLTHGDGVDKSQITLKADGSDVKLDKETTSKGKYIVTSLQDVVKHLSVVVAGAVVQELDIPSLTLGESFLSTADISHLTKWGAQNDYEISQTSSMGKPNVLLLEKDFNEMNTMGLRRYYLTRSGVQEPYATFLFKKWLGETYSGWITLTNNKVMWKVKALPGVEVRLYEQTEELGTVHTDEAGFGEVEISHYDEGLFHHIVVHGDGEVSFSRPYTHIVLSSSTKHDAQTVTTASTTAHVPSSVEIYAVLPNPEGTDSGDNEWVELSSEDGVPLEGMELLINEKAHDLPTLHFENEKVQRIYSKDIGASLLNKGAEMILQYNGKEIDRWTYGKSDEGEVLYRMQEDVKNLTRDSNTTGDSVKEVSKFQDVSKKSTALTVANDVQTASGDVISSLSDLSTQGVDVMSLGYSDIESLPKQSLQEQPVESNPQKSYAIGLLFLSLSLMFFAPFVEEK